MIKPAFAALFFCFTLTCLKADESASSSPPVAVQPQIPSKVFLITDYGAVGDGQTDSTAAIQKAIAAALAEGGGTVRIPDGTFLAGPLTLGNNLCLNLSDKATLRMIPLSAFPHSSGKDDPPFIGATGNHDIEISGHGTIDGQGASWWPAYRAKQLVQRRPQLIAIRDSHNLLFTGFCTLNPPNTHFSISNSSNVTFDSVTVTAPGNSPNTDGLNLGNVHDCLVENCTVATGDDNIVLLTSSKSPTGPGCSHFLINNCKLGVGHGLSIGSFTGGGVEDIKVTNCSFDGTTSGIRLKAGRDRGGLVQDISYDGITMTGVRNPVFISSYYPREPSSAEADPAQPITEKTPIWKNISIKNLTAKDCGSAGTIWGLAEMPVSHVTFENVSIAAKTGMTINWAQDIAFSGSQITVVAGPKIIQSHAQVSGIGSAKTAATP